MDSFKHSDKSDIALCCFVTSNYVSICLLVNVCCQWFIKSTPLEKINIIIGGTHTKIN